MAGLLLTGGTDVNPKIYGAVAQPETETPDDERDAVELELIAGALKNDLPILAICRGLQILNVFHGGTLIQHLPSAQRHVGRGESLSTPAHEVSIERGTLLAGMSDAKQWQVNSRHHQAADRIGADLRISARDTEDGTVEALERPDKRFVVAVQWHPEDQVFEYPEELKLFQSFAEALE
jgi:gamma-glutamyl-gamma-aminobutyrate hydrolase PuuD